MINAFSDGVLVVLYSMDQFYSILGLFTGGVSLAMSAISLFIGGKKKDETNLIFGFMGSCLVIFFLIPPVGFIVHDQPPYAASILIKRIFIYTYYALIPWFIASYTGFTNKKPIYAIAGLVVVGYVMMFLTIEDRPKPLWSLISVTVFGAILLYGLVASIWQYRRQDQVRARWLLVSMVIFGLLFLLTAINQLNFMNGVLNMKLFYPMHFHSICFMSVMGLRVVVDVFEKYKLESQLRISDRRWQLLMQNAHVVVVELDKNGNIMYINNFGTNALGFTKASDLLSRNWFDNFLAVPEVASAKIIFQKILADEGSLPFTKSKVVSKQGKEFTLSWANFLTYTDDGEVHSLMCVGRDVSSEESAFKIINQLKLELEKEKIVEVDKGGPEMPEEIIGSSQAMAYVIQKAKQVGPTHAPVLLEGETGVGKDLLAEYIHKISSRNTKVFIKVNCGALPKDLIEDELFGHEKGAFTSAISARKGRFELADGGTIFLDEIGELPLEMQPKLLRVLQNGEFERVGGQSTLKVDVRIIAATNRDLTIEVQQGNFRDDLFYRLNVFPITIPPLRRRKEDLSLLINYFIKRKSEKYNKTIEQISKADVQRLMEYGWPGNIRELNNVIERSVIATQGNTLALEWFLEEISFDESHQVNTLEQIERAHILKIMEECQWKINGNGGAAEKLEMNPNTLRSKMKKLGIFRPIKVPYETRIIEGLS